MSVRIIDNFLPEAMFHKADADSVQLATHGKEWRTHQLWGDHLVENSAPVLITDVRDDAINTAIAQRVHDQVGDHRQRTMYQHWHPGSYIPWHDDGVHQGAITIYLSQHSDNDGGVFMYRDGDDIRAVMPRPNRAVCVTPGTKHCVSTVNQGTPLRRTIQVWLKNFS